MTWADVKRPGGEFNLRMSAPAMKVLPAQCSTNASAVASSRNSRTAAWMPSRTEGPIALTPCVEHGRHDCGLEACCSVRPHWGLVNETLRGALAGVPLTQLAQPRVPA